MARNEQMTIDELAHETGVSSRNIRYYQTRGLLPPPKVKGRSGVYDERHVERLALLSELKSEGLNLQAIGFLLGGSGQVETDEVRNLKRAILDGWVSSEPFELPLKDMLKRIGAKDLDPGLFERAMELELIAPTDDDETVLVLLPDILAAGRALAELGVPFSRALDVLEAMREHAKGVAATYVELFDETVLAPWDERGRPAGEWRAIRESVEQLRPIAGEALLAVFNQVIGEEIAERIAATAPE